jgi:hypothetical protein
VRADTAESFTDVAVAVPREVPRAPVLMQAGDLVFFHGMVIHGSAPNRSATRFRRALIAHYASGDAARIARDYHPVLALDGRPIRLDVSDAESPRGVWVDRDGRPVVEIAECPDRPGVR